MSELYIYTDGGSRGNPGPAAAAFVVLSNDKIIDRGSLYLGIATNNYAEYKGVIIALDWLVDNFKKKELDQVNFILDSELVVRQLNKTYRVKNEEIKKLYDEVIKLIENVPCKFTFTSVAREKNKEADRLVNETLDSAKI